jgi:hypothetical protein
MIMKKQYDHVRAARSYLEARVRDCWWSSMMVLLCGISELARAGRAGFELQNGWYVL